MKQLEHIWELWIYSYKIAKGRREVIWVKTLDNKKKSKEEFGNKMMEDERNRGFYPP